MTINRRQFLQGALAGAGALMLDRTLSAEPASAGTFDPAERVTLGKTQIKVSRVGMGTGMRGGNRSSNHTRMGKEKFTVLVHEAWDRGVRFFDLADLYGTHPFFADTIGRKPRDQYVINTKIWTHPQGLPEPERPDADVVVRRFLKELKTDYIDMVLIHCLEKKDWPKTYRKQMDLLAALKDKGLIRAHGVSVHSVDALEAAAAEPWVDSVHARINPYGAKMDAPPAQVVPVLQKIHEAGKGVVGMKILGEGTFAKDDEKKSASIRFALTLGCVSTMIVGFEEPPQIEDFLARVRKVKRVGSEQ